MTSKTITALNAIAATLDIAEHTAAGYDLRDACRLAIANDDDCLRDFAAEAAAAGDDSAHLAAMDAVREKSGQGPAGARWNVAGMILDARLAA
jgi:hypothetical protein